MNGEPNGDVSRLRAYLTLIKDIWSTFGLPTIILVVLLLLWIGTLPSPLGEAREILEGVKTSIDKHLERDNEIIFYLKETCVSNAKLAKLPIEECLWRESR